VKIKVSKGKSVRLDIEYAGVARHTDVQQIEFIIASMIRICRQLTGRSLNPTRVRLMHRLGNDKAKLERLLDCTIDDDSGADRIEFPVPSWDLPLVSADPHLHRLCVQRCEEALAGRAKSASPLKVQVENAIAALLPPRTGAPRSRGGPAWHEPANPGAAIVVRGFVIRRNIGRRAVRFGAPLSRGSYGADFRNCLAARLRGDRHIHARIPTLDRNAAQHRAGAAEVAGRSERFVVSRPDIGVKQQISGSKRQDAAGAFPLCEPPHINETASQ
jgi:hypothetical protein